MTACLVTEDATFETDTAENAALSINALSINALSINALSINALSINALSINRLDADTLAFNTLQNPEITATEEGRMVLRYIARCALKDGDVLRVEHSDQIWEYPGVLGVAAGWETEALDIDGQERVSACLLAHVNAFGIEVPISLRGPGLAEADVLESERFYYGDGAFYGNLNAEHPTKFSCEIRGNRYLGGDGNVHTPSSPDADLRVCGAADTAEDCGFEFTGYCDEICNEIERDGDQWRFSACLGADGERYDNVFTVWLRGSGAESCEQAPAGYSCSPL
ncbi:hypothetical protein [Haliangium ochraceum]|nr:hypothetical protein [Haliangium ochraceum]